MFSQEESDTDEYEVTESESEEIIDSQKSDSDFEMFDEKDSSGSEVKEEVYHRPTTRSSSQNFVQESVESTEGIRTRSRAKKQEGNNPPPAPRPKSKQDDFDALLLYSLKVVLPFPSLPSPAELRQAPARQAPHGPSSPAPRLQEIAPLQPAFLRPGSTQGRGTRARPGGKGA